MLSLCSQDLFSGNHFPGERTADSFANQAEGRQGAFAFLLFFFHSIIKAAINSETKFCICPFCFPKCDCICVHHCSASGCATVLYFPFAFKQFKTFRQINFSNFSLTIKQSLAN